MRLTGQQIHHEKWTVGVHETNTLLLSLNCVKNRKRQRNREEEVKTGQKEKMRGACS